MAESQGCDYQHGVPVRIHGQPSVYLRHTDRYAGGCGIRRG